MTDFIQNIRYQLARFSVLERLIAINILLFVLPFFIKSVLFLFSRSISNSIFSWVELSPHIDAFVYRPWTILTYGFFHASIGHLFFNMFLLYFSGRILLNLFDGRRFLNVYLLGIIAGGLFFLMSYNIFPVFQGHFIPMIGASAGVMAVLIFVCTYIPQQQISLIFFNIKLWQLGLFFVVLDVLQLPYGNAGGHLAHLGGAILGYLYAKQLSKGNDIGAWFAKLMDWFFNLFKPKKPFSNLKTVYKKKSIPVKKNNVKTTRQQKIDDILDKISKSGYDSLTQTEKDFLFRAGNE